MGRRGALGWILGGTLLLAAGAGVGIYFFTKNGDSPTTGTNAAGLPASPALHILKGHSASVTSISLLPDGSKLASGSLDQTVRLWSTSSGDSLGTIQAGSAVNALAWSPDGSKLATGEENRSVSLWKANGSSIKHEAGWGAAIKALAWSSDGNLLFFGTNGNGLHALEISNYRHLGKNAPLTFINAIAISPDGALLAAGLESGRVVFADLKNDWALVAAIEPAHGAALSVAWSHDQSLVAVGYADGIAVIYDTGSRQVKYLLKHRGAVNGLAWSPNSSSSSPMLVSGAADGTVNIWNLQGTGTQIVYSGHNDAVLAVAWGANMLASASKDQTAILWQLPNS
jgi:WD40 repeat protein